MTYCLYCFQTNENANDWQSFFHLRKQLELCHMCMHQLELIKGSTCDICSRKVNGDARCQDCERWEDNPKFARTLEKNISVYAYNEQMKEMIARWKYRGDYLLGKAFQSVFLKTFKKHFKDVYQDALIIPIPLSEERLKERAFNQSDMLAQFLPKTDRLPLRRVDQKKQAKKTRHERLRIKNPFILEEKVNKTVILVDDIYTTGMTLRYAAKTLREKGCPKVYSFTLVRG